MNFGSHTPAQVAKLLPELEAEYRKAEGELGTAQANLDAARRHVVEAEQALTAALAKYLGSFPEHVVVKAIQPGACGCGQLHPPDARCAGGAPTRAPFPGEPGYDGTVACDPQEDVGAS